MPLYENSRNAENRINIKDGWKNAIIFGTEETLSRIAEKVQELRKRENRRVTLAFEGWYGIDWGRIITSIEKVFDRHELKVEPICIGSVCKSNDEVQKYKEPFLSSDPGFGVVNADGRIRDLIDEAKLKELKDKLRHDEAVRPVEDVGW
jgi:hypothetical protein